MKNFQKLFNINWLLKEQQMKFISIYIISQNQAGVHLSIRVLCISPAG